MKKYILLLAFTILSLSCVSAQPDESLPITLDSARVLFQRTIDSLQLGQITQEQALETFIQARYLSLATDIGYTRADIANMDATVTGGIQNFSQELQDHDTNLDTRIDTVLARLGGTTSLLVPSVPESFSATPNTVDGYMVISAGFAEDASWIIIYRKELGTDTTYLPVSLLGNPTATGGTVVYADYDVTSNVSYEYYAVGLNQYGVSSGTAIETAIITSTTEAPVAPNNLAFTQDSTIGGNLTWNDRSSLPQEEGFYVEWKYVDDGSWTTKAIAGQDVESYRFYTTHGFLADTVVQFRVRSFVTEYLTGGSTQLLYGTSATLQHTIIDTSSEGPATTYDLFANYDFDSDITGLNWLSPASDPSANDSLGWNAGGGNGYASIFLDEVYENGVDNRFGLQLDQNVLFDGTTYNFAMTIRVPNAGDTLGYGLQYKAPEGVISGILVGPDTLVINDSFVPVAYAFDNYLYFYFKYSGITDSSTVELDSIRYTYQAGGGGSTTPTEPTWVSSYAINETNIYLGWTPSDSTEVIYNTSNTTSGATVFDTLDASNIIVTGLSASTTYYFWVRRVVDGIWSDYSAVRVQSTLGTYTGNAIFLASALLGGSASGDGSESSPYNLEAFVAYVKSNGWNPLDTVNVLAGSYFAPSQADLDARGGPGPAETCAFWGGFMKGAEGNRIVIQKYGTGDDPIFSAENAGTYSVRMYAARHQEWYGIRFKGVFYISNLEDRGNEINGYIPTTDIKITYCFFDGGTETDTYGGGFLYGKAGWTDYHNPPSSWTHNQCPDSNSYENVLAYATANGYNFPGAWAEASRIHFAYNEYLNCTLEDDNNFWTAGDSIYYGYNINRQTSEEAIDIAGGAHHTIEYNIIIPATPTGPLGKGNGIKIAPEYDHLTDILIRNNIIQMNQGARGRSAAGFCLGLVSVKDAIILNNTFLGGGDDADPVFNGDWVSNSVLSFRDGESSSGYFGYNKNVLFQNNIFSGRVLVAGSGATGVADQNYAISYFYDSLAVRNISFKNNLWYQSDDDFTDLLRIDETASNVLGELNIRTSGDLSTYWFTKSWSTGEVYGDPTFADENYTGPYDIGDLRIQAGSPAQGAGLAHDSLTNYLQWDWSVQTGHPSKNVTTLPTASPNIGATLTSGGTE